MCCFVTDLGLVFRGNSVYAASLRCALEEGFEGFGGTILCKNLLLLRIARHSDGTHTCPIFLKRGIVDHVVPCDAVHGTPVDSLVPVKDTQGHIRRPGGVGCLCIPHKPRGEKSQTWSRMSLIHPHRAGKGASVREGVRLFRSPDILASSEVINQFTSHRVRSKYRISWPEMQIRIPLPHS